MNLDVGDPIPPSVVASDRFQNLRQLVELIYRTMTPIEEASARRKRERWAQGALRYRTTHCQKEATPCPITPE